MCLLEIALDLPIRLPCLLRWFVVWDSEPEFGRRPFYVGASQEGPFLPLSCSLHETPQVHSHPGGPERNELLSEGGTEGRRGEKSGRHLHCPPNANLYREPKREGKSKELYLSGWFRVGSL